MIKWRLETTPAFERSARKLDPSMLRRVREYLNELSLLEDPRVRGKLLHADRSGLWRYRIGDYRVIASIDGDRLVIVSIGLGHRSQVDRKVR